MSGNYRNMGVSTDEIFAQQATRLFERFRNSFQATITVIPSSIEVIFAEVNDFFFQGADFRGIRFDRFRFVDGCCIFFLRRLWAWNYLKIHWFPLSVEILFQVVVEKLSCELCNF